MNGPPPPHHYGAQVPPPQPVQGQSLNYLPQPNQQFPPQMQQAPHGQAPLMPIMPPRPPMPGMPPQPGFAPQPPQNPQFMQQPNFQQPQQPNFAPPMASPQPPPMQAPPMAPNYPSMSQPAPPMAAPMNMMHGQQQPMLPRSPVPPPMVQPQSFAPRLPTMEQAPMPQMGGVGMPNAGGFSGPHGQPPVAGLVGQAPDVEIFRRPPMSPVNPPVASDFVRCSMSKIPKTSTLLGKAKVPLGVTVTPYPKNTEGFEVPLINGVIVRCRRCRSYLNPYVEQVEQGARWRCNLCMLVNEFPPSFDVDPTTTQYVDRSNKAELKCPVYEFVAPVEYMIRPPQPPAFVFVIDVSHLAVTSGMTATAAKIIMDCLDRLPNETGLSRMALIAVDSAVHFFNLGLNTPEPQSLVVPDLKDIVIPYRVSDLLVSINECRTNLESILQKLPNLFASTQKATVAFGSALNAACNLIAPIGGKVIGLLSSLPTIGEGAVQNRDDSKLYGTPRESSLLQPASNFYKLLATEATKNQVAVDLFLFPSAYMDVATVSCISKYTGGQLFMYPGFNAARAEDAVKFAADFSSFLESEFGMEAVLRIRASQGVSIPTYHGSFFFRSSDLLALPNIPQDHSYSAQLTIDDTLPSHAVGIQAAFLHTTCSGERRIRVVNASFPISEDPRDLVQWIDTGATVDIMAKIAIDKIQSGKIEDGRDYLFSKLCEIMTFYRLAHGIGSNQQLQVCDSLRALPILVLGAIKSFALRPTSNIPVDIRSFTMNVIKCGSVTDNVYMFAPYLLPIHLLPDTAGVPDKETGKIVLPPALNLGSDRIERNGVYLLDDGRELVFYVGAGASSDTCAQLFGKPYHQLTAGKVLLPRPEGPLAKRIGNIVNKLSTVHRSTPSVYLVKEDSEPGLRAVFFSKLIEDRGASDAVPSYQQFLSSVREKSNA